jgi:large subunit ribosomal protein LP1
MSNPELACTYAALILHDENIPITADKLSALLTAANVKIPPFWPNIFARALQGRKLDDLILNVGGGGAPAPSTGTAPAKEEKGGKPEEKKDDKGGKGGKGGKDEDKGGKGKKEEPKKEEPKKEEEDEDMGFGLFD